MSANSDKARSPLKNGPRTIESEDSEGNKILTVHLAAIGPRMARLADWLAIGMTLGAVFGAVHLSTFMDGAPDWQYWSLLALPPGAYLFSKVGLYHVLQRRLSVVFTPDRFIVHRLFGNKVFDRNMPHKFSLYYHRLSEREERILSLRESEARGKFWNFARKRYFGDSRHLAFEYMGQRNDMLLIYGELDAYEILSAMNARDELMDGYSKKGRGQVLNPEEEWPDQAGELQGTI